MFYVLPDAMSTRRSSREVAVQVLFQHHFTPEIDLDQCLSLYKNHFLKDQESWNYAAELIDGVLKNRSVIDEAISAKSLNWKIDRISGVDLNILRVAVFELKFQQMTIPRKVAINEAIEIAKKFGGKDSSSFVNGILDQVS